MVKKLEASGSGSDSRRESLGTTFSRRGCLSAHPKVLVPKQRLIVSRTLSSGPTASAAIPSKLVQFHLSPWQNHAAEVPQPLFLSDVTSTSSGPPTATPVVGDEDVFFPPVDKKELQVKRKS